MLLLVGIGVGAGAVLFAQERYLPPRLSADASARLRDAFERADAERQRLQSDLAKTSDRLRGALEDRKRLETELAARSETVQHLRDDIAAVVAALPPDPRGAPVAVRAARFEVQGNALAYSVVLSRERAGSSPFGGVLQFVIAGASGRSDDTVTLGPVPVSVGVYDTLHGSLPLPTGFRPRQATIHVLDRVGGKLMGLRVINVG